MLLAVKSAPPLTTVSPVPVIGPTCWFVPLTSNDPPEDCWLLFVMAARFAPPERAEADPASSSVAPDATVAVTPVPTVAALVAAIRSAPALTRIALLLARLGAELTRSVPVPALVSVKPPSETTPLTLSGLPPSIVQV